MIIQNKVKFTVVIFVIAAFVLTLGMASATMIYVPEGGNQTIQQAVDNASANDIIIVRNGTYSENVLVNVDNLTIRSEYGSANCIVTANDTNDHVFNVTADWVNITGFTVQNATGGKAGIYLSGVEHCTISENNVTNNYDYGIWLNSAHQNNLINNIVTYTSYWGFELDYANNNTLSNNTASYNGWQGIVIANSRNNTLTDNIAHANGYDGIYLTNSTHTRLIRNRASGHKNSSASFDIHILRNGEWIYQGDFSFYNYETRELPLQHDTGDLTLRLVQHGHDAAYVDYVALKKADTVLTPATAVNLNTGADIRYKIVKQEYDVCDAWNSTLELRWENVPADTTLVMRAMEEDLGAGHGSPLYYPLLREGRTLAYTPVNDGGIIVDGSLEESKEPAFSVFWRPDTPHPDGYTYGWLHAYDLYLYAAVEVTGDNTPDEEDWGALFIMVNGKLQEFRVSPADTTWGHSGFQYTTAVPYEHRVYEFKIPLSEINARIGDELHYGFGAYGTFAEHYSGITLTFYSDNNSLEGNIVTDNDNGIFATASSNNTITCNLVYANTETGIYLPELYWGNSTDNIIRDNNIMANGKYNSTSGGWEWNFWNQHAVGVNATNNYWGTTVSSEIAASINEGTGTVTYEPFLSEPAPCAPLIEIAVNKTVWDPVTEGWVPSRLAMINETLRFTCTIQNTGTLNHTQLRFWDILDCSLEYAGNATMTIPSLGIEDQTIDLEITPRYQQPYNYTFKQRVLHPNDSFWDPRDPISDSCIQGKAGCPIFVELCPETKEHYLHGWDDTDNDGRVSACDQLWLESYEEWYHVDNVPYTLLVNNTETGESMYFDSVLDYEAINLSEPNGTAWTKVCWLEACCGKEIYTLETWTDNSSSPDGDLSANDTITLRNERTGNVTEYTVTELATDLVVSMEWEVDHLLNNSLSQPVGALAPETEQNSFIVTGPIDPLNLFVLEPGQTITIEYDATVIRCGGLDNNTFRAKGNPEYMPPDVWHYSNEDVVTITVPCQTGDATEVSGLVKDVYTTAEDVYAKGSGFDPIYNGIMDIYIFDDHTWTAGLDIATLPEEPYASLFNVSIDADGTVGPVKIWDEGDTFIGEFDMFFDANGNGIYEPLIDAVDNPHDPGLSIIGEQVPVLMPLGIAALIGLLSVIATSTLIRKRKKR
jgi:uncharacterized repeat protein (TIGR01451 family)